MQGIWTASRRRIGLVAMSLGLLVLLATPSSALAGRSLRRAHRVAGKGGHCYRLILKSRGAQVADGTSAGAVLTVVADGHSCEQRAHGTVKVNGEEEDELVFGSEGLEQSCEAGIALTRGEIKQIVLRGGQCHDACPVEWIGGFATLNFSPGLVVEVSGCAYEASDVNVQYKGKSETGIASGKEPLSGKGSKKGGACAKRLEAEEKLTLTDLETGEVFEGEQPAAKKAAHSSSDAGAPVIASESAGHVNSKTHRSVLGAVINPEGSETKYEFWVLRCGSRSGECPRPEVVGSGTLPAGNENQTVEATATELPAGSSHSSYWVVATNASGTTRGKAHKLRKGSGKKVE